MNFSPSQGLGFGKTGKFTYMHFFVFFFDIHLFKNLKFFFCSRPHAIVSLTVLCSILSSSCDLGRPV